MLADKDIFNSSSRLMRHSNIQGMPSTRRDERNSASCCNDISGYLKSEHKSSKACLWNISEMQDMEKYVHIRQCLDAHVELAASPLIKLTIQHKSKH